MYILKKKAFPRFFKQVILPKQLFGNLWFFDPNANLPDIFNSLSSRLAISQKTNGVLSKHLGWSIFTSFSERGGFKRDELSKQNSAPLVKSHQHPVIFKDIKDIRREQKLMNYLHPILPAFQLPTAGTALNVEPLIPVYAGYQPRRERSQAKNSGACWLHFHFSYTSRC